MNLLDKFKNTFITPGVERLRFGNFGVTYIDNVATMAVVDKITSYTDGNSIKYDFYKSREYAGIYQTIPDGSNMSNFVKRLTKDEIKALPQEVKDELGIERHVTLSSEQRGRREPGKEADTPQR